MAILVINQHIITYTEHASQVLSATDLNNYKFSVYINIHVNSRLVYPLICGSLSTYRFTTIYKYYIYITKSDMKLNKRWPLLLRYRSYKCSEVQIINLEVASIINKINWLYSILFKWRFSEYELVVIYCCELVVRTFHSIFENHSHKKQFH